LANALNTGLSGLARPIFASGANLLFKKQVFDEVDDLASHAHHASGDDTYLLRDFRKNKKAVRLESSLEVAVHTETPQTFRQFIDQRLRWVGKTTDIGDSLASVAAIGQFILAIGFFAGLIFWSVQGNWKEFFMLFSFKIGMDLVFFLPFFVRTKRPITWILIPIYELLFPIYSLLLGVLMLAYQPKWKGRPIQSRNS
jgi:poly-beta-1,6-N-acetyl-D-glucosamine synthase